MSRIHSQVLQNFSSVKNSSTTCELILTLIVVRNWHDSRSKKKSFRRRIDANIKDEYKFDEYRPFALLAVYLSAAKFFFSTRITRNLATPALRAEEHAENVCSGMYFFFKTTVRNNCRGSLFR